MRFKTVEEDISPLLKTDATTRCDDMRLYYKYVEVMKDANITLAFTSSKYRYSKNIAPYETVSRVRRKLQEKHPELRPTPAQIEGKKKAVKDYKSYAKDKERLIKNDEQLAGQKNIFDYI